MKALKASEDFGKTVVEDVQLMSLDMLGINEDYNRKINKGHVFKLASDMIVNGYNPAQIIEVNENREVIDGQHRFEGAKLADLPSVPVITVTFPNKVKEAAYFIHVNKTQKKQTAKEQWKSRLAAHDRTAMAMYNLHSDPTAVLYRNIDLFKTPQYDISPKVATKVSASYVAAVLNLVMCGQNIAHKKTNASALNDAINGTSFSVIRQRTDNIFNIIYGCFGSRNACPAAFNDTSLRSFLSFLKILMDNGRLDTEKHIKQVIKKIAKVDVTGWASGDQGWVVSKYVEAYNKSFPIGSPKRVTYTQGG